MVEEKVADWRKTEKERKLEKTERRKSFRLRRKSFKQEKAGRRDSPTSKTSTEIEGSPSLSLVTGKIFIVASRFDALYGGLHFSDLG